MEENDAAPSGRANASVVQTTRKLGLKRSIIIVDVPFKRPEYYPSPAWKVVAGRPL